VSTIPKEIRDQFDRLWKRGEWSLLEEPVRDGDIPVFRKGCNLFTFFVCRHEAFPESYVLSIEDATATGLYTQNIEVLEQGENGDRRALERADEFIQEFMKAGIQAWMGFELTPTRPANEIRIKQTSVNEGGIVGVGDDDRVYAFAKSGWLPLPMKKLTEEEAEKELTEIGGIFTK